MIESMLSRLSSIPADKVSHFAVGVLLYGALLPFIGYRYALASVVIVGFLKEVYDTINKDKHTPDVWDALATSFGGAVAFFCTIN